LTETRSPWSLRIGSFLLAEVISAIGSFGTMIAIWAYGAYRYHASAGQISLYGVAFTIPGVLLSPIAGVIVDRVGQRQTLIAAKALGIVASLALLTAHSFGMLTLLSALHGVANAVARPAFASMPPRMVDDEYLARTNALVGLTEQISIVLGPVAAGVTIGLFGFKGAFLFDAASYALGIVVLPLVHLTRVRRDPASAAGHPLRDAAAGLRIVANSPVVRRVVIASFTLGFLYGSSMLAEPLYVRDVLHRSTNVFASLQTVFGLLLVFGGLIAAHAGERMANLKWVAIGVFGSGVSAVLYLGTTTLLIAYAGVAAWGLATGFAGGPSATVLQRATDESAHGRVMATDQLSMHLAMFLGLGAGGVVIGAVGVRPWILVLGPIVAAVGLALGASDRAARRTAPAGRPAPLSADQPQDAPPVPR
jgi:MFS family permease